jgi:hypothetical protein
MNLLKNSIGSPGLAAVVFRRSGLQSRNLSITVAFGQF